jgi:hypothetical protein
MKRGFVSWPVSNMNIRPGTTSFRLQAASYALKFAGYSRLNCAAIPRPMKPTQLTVLTMASVSARRMLPFVNSIVVPQKYQLG